MALLPIIYTSLIVVLGLFLIVFSFSYISYKMRKIPVKASFANPQANRENEKIKIKLKEASDKINHPVMQNQKDIVVIREEKKISSNVRHHDKHQKKTPKAKSRFSIINADDIRKFNHLPENIAVSSLSSNSSITFSNVQHKDILRFYDE